MPHAKTERETRARFSGSLAAMLRTTWEPGMLRRIRGWGRALARRDLVEREMHEEMEYHLERAVERLMARGMSRADAHAEARREFGHRSSIEEHAREARGVRLLQDAIEDLRYAVRGVGRRPGFTFAVVATLGLGIGANASMFAIVDRLLFRPPPLMKDPSSAHRVYLFETVRGKEVPGFGGQYAKYADLTRWTSSFESTAAFSGRTVAVGVGDAAREMPIAVVSPSFFSFFDAPPALGRYYAPAEDVPPSGSPVAVASYGTWRLQFGGRQDILGSTVRIGQAVYTVIGVAPPGFVGLSPNQPPAYFIPISAYAAGQNVTDKEPWWKTYHWGWMQMIVRTKPGVSDAVANADLTQALLKSWEQQRQESPDIPPASMAKPRGVIGSILQERGPNTSGFAKVATWLHGVAVVVLLIACANVANLLFARALQRRREVAIRLALGVSRRRLLSQLFTESVLLALAGGVAGVIVAQWSSAGLRAAFLPKTAQLSVLRDERTLLFAGIAAIAAGLITGLAPALQAGRANLTSDLKSGTREGMQSRSRLRIALLLFQVAFSMVLLVGAGLFVRSLGNVRNIRLGYDVDPILVVDINMRGVAIDSVQSVELRRRLLEAATAAPGVERASFETGVPFNSFRSRELFVAGIDTVAKFGQFSLSAVSPDYFATIGTRILRGRGIAATDVEHSPLVLVASKAMTNALWPGQDAIGKCVRLDADTMPCRTVVGIAEDIKAHRLSDEASMFYYMPATQFHPDQTSLYVRIARNRDATEAVEGVRRALQRTMPGASYVTVTPFADLMSGQTRSWLLGASMFTAFGVLALVLAAIGLYGVIAYGVAQRTHELGIRMALGAQAADVQRLVVREGLVLGAAGVALGGTIAFEASRWVAPLLFDESPRDPAVYGVVALSLLFVAAAASWLPAVRASRVDPMRALRHE